MIDSLNVQAALSFVQRVRVARPDLNDDDAAELYLLTALGVRAARRSDLLSMGDEVSVYKESVARAIQRMLATREIRQWRGLYWLRPTSDEGGDGGRPKTPADRLRGDIVHEKPYVRAVQEDNSA